jgi:hypothetical protein
MGMQNEEANFEELHSLSTQLGQEQKRQFGQVEEKWKQLEKTWVLFLVFVFNEQTHRDQCVA